MITDPYRFSTKGTAMFLKKSWEQSPDDLLNKTIQQIVAMAGDGVLRDNSVCAQELRWFLQRVGRDNLLTYAQYCLDEPFQLSGFVLQDIINEVGRRLGFDVTHGIYRGKSNQNNYDGLWEIGNWSFIIEVKTTDAYSISLDKIANYLKELELAQAGGDVSCLIVVGRKDTATLEDQLRGSRHNWDMRIIGVDALFRALELRELSEAPELSSRLVEILKPQEFTRVDQILMMAFEFATDREEALENMSSNSGFDGAVERNTDVENASARSVISDRTGIEDLKVLIGERLAKEFNVSLTRKRSSFESRADGLRFCVAVSKPYDNFSGHWFAYNPRQSEFLNDAKHGFFVLGHLDTGKAFRIPVRKMDEMALEIHTTVPNADESKKYYHIHSRSREDGEFLLTRRGHSEINITEYEI